VGIKAPSFPGLSCSKAVAKGLAGEGVCILFAFNPGKQWKERGSALYCNNRMETLVNTIPRLKYQQMEKSLVPEGG
jgi:hypothetical protein